ncbi:MAG TPA: hypothetical protein VKW08_00235 [Xanthobacteraceae bacterium]|nr:hypothetical protein [Xanthobacteraceae bacterium]
MPKRYDNSELDKFNALIARADKFGKDANDRKGSTTPPKNSYEAELDSFNAQMAEIDDFVQAAQRRRDG